MLFAAIGTVGGYVIRDTADHRAPAECRNLAHKMQDGESFACPHKDHTLNYWPDDHDAFLCKCGEK